MLRCVKGGVWAAYLRYVTLTRKRQALLTIETNGNMSFNSISGSHTVRQFSRFYLWFCIFILSNNLRVTIGCHDIVPTTLLQQYSQQYYIEINYKLHPLKGISIEFSGPINYNLSALLQKKNCFKDYNGNIDKMGSQMVCDNHYQLHYMM